jgi:Phytanoyl-CoA dioxygenase (PhyH)
MNELQIAWQEQLADDGYFLLPQVFSPEQSTAALHSLNRAFRADGNGSTLRTEAGSIYGARNLLQIWPDIADVWRQPPLPEIMQEVLGEGFGLVRVLFFDKPPEQSWALPWHKDLTIAVKDNRLPSTCFHKPTRKIGVPHVEAPPWLLENMLTLRWHLDDMTPENGPLRVVPGSHLDGKETASRVREPVTILGRRGDILLMRPLLSHCSYKSHQDTRCHRRILHFEFAGVEHLPDGYLWHDFLTQSPLLANRADISAPVP